jgi:hypothetical protein
MAIPDNLKRDADGDVIPYDDVSILNEDDIIRRVPHHQLIGDPKFEGGRRVSSAVFNPSSPEFDKYQGLSVDIKKLIEADGLDPAKYVKSPKHVIAVKVKAGAFRNQNLKIGFDPLESNPYHGAVWGNFTDSVKRKLCAAYTWLALQD